MPAAALRVQKEGFQKWAKVRSVAGMQGGLGRAGVLIECHNLLPAPFQYSYIPNHSPPAPFLSGKWPSGLLHCSLRIYNGTCMEMNR